MLAHLSRLTTPVYTYSRGEEEKAEGRIEKIAAITTACQGTRLPVQTQREK
jgi:hypothetical protein